MVQRDLKDATKIVKKIHKNLKHIRKFAPPTLKNKIHNVDRYLEKAEYNLKHGSIKKAFPYLVRARNELN